MQKLLFIEDENLINEAYKNYFDGKYQLEFAVSGTEGIQKALDWHPDLIILDIILSGNMNGFDILRELKNNSQTKDIKVIILTNLQTEEETALASGALACLIKSNTTMEQINEIINKHI